MDAWKIAEKAVSELPPYLADDELTAERLYTKNKGKLSGIDDARTVLKELVDAGKLRVEERRNRRGGSKIKVYLPV